MSDDSNRTRRTFLGSMATVGAAGLAGCTGMFSGNDSEGTPTGTGTPTPTEAGTETATPEETETETDSGNGDQKQPDDPGSYEPMEPKAASFQDLSYWTAHSGVTLEGDTETYYQGTQSARIEGRSGSIERTFPVPINLENKDLSLAMKIGGPVPTQLRVYLYDTGGNATQLLQRIHGSQTGGWVRVNPSINTTDADMSSIQRVMITLDGGGAEKKYWVDDLRFHNKAADKGQVMFTFDYIHRSIYEVAYPIMEEHGVKGCLAVPADQVGNADRMTYDELKELQEAGWEIASMTNDWEPLNGQKESIQRKRMERSIRLLDENGLGKPAAVMYPKGFCDATSVAVADELHDLAFVRFNESEAGLSQSAIMGPNFVNRSRPNTPEAAKNQIDPAMAYNGLYTIAHSQLGPNAENTRSEFREMVEHVSTLQKQGKLEVVTPSDVVLK